MELFWVFYLWPGLLNHMDNWPRTTSSLVDYMMHLKNIWCTWKIYGAPEKLYGAPEKLYGAPEKGLCALLFKTISLLFLQVARHRLRSSLQLISQQTLGIRVLTGQLDASMMIRRNADSFARTSIWNISIHKTFLDWISAKYLVSFCVLYPWEAWSNLMGDMNPLFDNRCLIVVVVPSWHHMSRPWAGWAGIYKRHDWESF